jgi:hypothetical protein
VFYHFLCAIKIIKLHILADISLDFRVADVEHRKFKYVEDGDPVGIFYISISMKRDQVATAILRPVI